MTPIRPPWSIADREARDNWDALALEIANMRASIPGFTTGDLKMGAYSDTPDGWLLCDGSSFDPVVYPSLYAKIGTTYGGTATAPLLPDLRGRVPAGVGNGDASGHTLHSLGDKVGKETHTLTSAESGLPAHTHTNSDDVLFNVAGGGAVGYSAGAATLNHGAVTIAANTAANASSAHENRTPSTVVNFFIKT